MKTFDPEQTADSPAYGLKYYITRLFIGTIIAAALCSAITFRHGADISAENINQNLLFPEFKTGQRVFGDWRFTGKQLLSDKNAVRLSFLTRRNEQIDIYFSTFESDKPCFDRTSCFNIAYRNKSGSITSDDEMILKRMLSDIKLREKNLKCTTRDTFHDRYKSIEAVTVVAMVAFFFSLFIWIGRVGKSSTAKPTNIAFANRGISKLNLIPHLLLLILISSRLAAKVRWNYIEADGFYFFQNCDLRNILRYILSDDGMPAIPYRFILTMLSTSDGFFAVQAVNLIFAIAAVALTYLISLRYTRKSLAWIAPVALALNAVFITSMNELRGYPLFIMLVMLAIYINEIISRRPHPLIFLAWLTVQWLAVASNPITVVVFFAFFVTYPHVIRKKFPPSIRIMADLYMILLAVGFATLAPIALGTTSFHVMDTLSPVYEKVAFFKPLTFYYLGCVIVFIITALKMWRDDRSTLFIAVSFGFAAMLVLIYVKVLHYHNAYFLYIIPLSHICWLILLEITLRSAERSSKRLSVVIVSTAFMSVCAWSIFVTKPRHLFDIHLIMQMHRRIHFMEKTVSNADTSAPVLILPKDAFYYYLIDKQKYDVFKNNLVDSPDFRQVPSPAGESIYRWKNYYTCYRPIVYPSNIFKGPFHMLIFERFISYDNKLRNGIYGDSKCRLIRKVSGESFTEWLCTPLLNVDSH